MAEVSQAVMSAMTSGNLPAVLQIQQDFFNHSREALTAHMSKTGEAMKGMAQEATGSLQSSMKQLRNAHK